MKHCGKPMRTVALKDCNGWHCTVCGYEYADIVSFKLGQAYECACVSCVIDPVEEERIRQREIAQRQHEHEESVKRQKARLKIPRWKKEMLEL